MAPIALFFIVCQYSLVNAQDAYIRHFNVQSSYHNPSLVGQTGSLAFTLQHRSQFASFTSNQFSSSFLSIEESVPCLPFDWGIYTLNDQEGSGILQTFEGGINVAGTYGFITGNSIHNIRIGLSPRWFYKRVDYSRLIFSDQLNPKYGLLNELRQTNMSSFAAPNNQSSLLSFSPSIGISVKSIWNSKNSRSVSSIFGFSIHHALSLGSDNGPIESLLRNDVSFGIPLKVNAFMELQFIPSYDKKVFFTVSPILFHERQSSLSYTELGAKFGLNNNFQLGVFVHSSSTQLNVENTNWFSIAIDIGTLIAKTRRVDLGISYSNNISGLKNLVGPTLEVSAIYHIAKSPTCNLNGKENLVPYGNDVKCPTKSFTPGRNKIYENIWYKTIFKKYQ